MLVLTRRVGEVLRIGDTIEVTVMGVKGNQVRIGINAPRNVTVDREEVAERKQRERDPSRVAIDSVRAIAATIAESGKPDVDIARRHASGEPALIAATSVAAPLTPPCGKKPTLRMGRPKSKNA